MNRITNGKGQISQKIGMVPIRSFLSLLCNHAEYWASDLVGFQYLLFSFSVIAANASVYGRSRHGKWSPWKKPVITSVSFVIWLSLLLRISWKKNFSCIPDKEIHVFYLDRQFFSCTPDKDIRMFHLYRQIFSCIPDKDIRVFHLCLQILSHPCYLTRGWIKITCI